MLDKLRITITTLICQDKYSQIEILTAPSHTFALNL